MPRIKIISVPNDSGIPERIRQGWVGVEFEAYGPKERKFSAAADPMEYQTHLVYEVPVSVALEALKKHNEAAWDWYAGASIRTFDFIFLMEICQEMPKLKVKMKGRKPEIRLWFPVWWHENGYRLRVKELNVDTKVLVLSATAAKLTISPHVLTENKGWDVDWEIVQSYPRQEKANGRVFFFEQQLRAAFYLSDDLDKGDAEVSQWLLDRYGGDLAVQGSFIRFKNFLNIPCPGTGHDGDPNISIEITEEIKEAVRQLLEGKS